MRRYSLRVPAAEAELALLQMLEWFPAGVEEQRDGGQVVISGYAEHPPAGGLAEQDVADGWEDGWREFHQPVRQGAGSGWRRPGTPTQCRPAACRS